MSIYDWNHIKKIHTDAKWAARDCNNVVYLYRSEPLRINTMWIARETDDCIGVYYGDFEPCDWRDSLEKAPE